MNFNLKKFNFNNAKPQLDQETSDFHKNSADTLTQTM